MIYLHKNYATRAPSFIGLVSISNLAGYHSRSTFLPTVSPIISTRETAFISLALLLHSRTVQSESTHFCSLLYLWYFPSIAKYLPMDGDILKRRPPAPLQDDGLFPTFPSASSRSLAAPWDFPLIVLPIMSLVLVVVDIPLDWGESLQLRETVLCRNPRCFRS